MQTTCHQYQRKLDTFEEDKKRLGSQFDVLSGAPLTDFTVEPCDDVQLVNDFIVRYEWLGTPGNYTTNRYTVRHTSGELAGVLTFDMPNAFSSMLGDNTRKLERLISRGATASWTPKGLGSYMLSRAIQHMVQETPYRLFTAYADPSAGELGTIYQALNFYYLGNRFGTTVQYYYNGSWKSDRIFRSRSAYKRYAKELGIEWDSAWQDGDRIIWRAMPDGVEFKLREHSKKVMRSCEFRIPPRKHKYAYVLGTDRRETRKLRRTLEELNKTYPYPKERGK